MRIMKAADGVQPSKFDAPALGDILRPELRTPPEPPHSSKIDTVMEDISEKHVLFSPLWGRFPALDWEWGFSETQGCLRCHHVPSEPRRKLGKGVSKVLRC